jgi:phosphotransferase system HPr (HPr) family protein
MNNQTITRTVIVRNEQGLHARPADLLVRLATQFESNIQIGKDGQLVDCKSILSLLTLGAAQGTELFLSAEGGDAEGALHAIGELFESGFENTSSIERAKPAVDS